MLFVIALMLFKVTYAQNVNTIDASVQVKQAYIEPEFPGGKKAFVDFLRNNLQYPNEAKKQNISGIVELVFTVEKDGTLSDLRFSKMAGYGFDEEVLRVIKLSPKWKPGIKGGLEIRTQHSIRINFTCVDGCKQSIEIGNVEEIVVKYNLNFQEVCQHFLHL